MEKKTDKKRDEEIKEAEGKLFNNEWEYVVFAQNQILSAMGINLGGEEDDE